MTQVLIDTNVFIDLIMNREDVLNAAKVLSYAENDEFSLHASVLSMANIAYVLRKAIGIDRLYSGLSKFEKFVYIESLSRHDFQTALSLKAKDFEDALQYACAKSSNCTIIVTRNKNYPIRVRQNLLSDGLLF